VSSNFEHALAAPPEFDYWRTVIPTFDDEGRSLFRAACESVRPLPDGVTRRAPFFDLLCTAYYFESLYVQDQHGPAGTERLADRLRERIRATLDEVR